MSLRLPSRRATQCTVRFNDHGPDIPRELLEAQGRGETTFVCGAGVSRTVGLPSFRGLIEAIYAALGEHWSPYPAEAAGIPDAPACGCNLPQALDRTLFALQLRRAGHDAARAGRFRSDVADAVQRVLLPPEGDLSAHHALLRLSRDVQMRPRIATTNFDTLFEHAWLRNGRGRIASSAATAMPAPGSADFEGVLHLHGRVGDEVLGLDRTEFVLTSAEFGEAYLRAGWAARFVYDLARNSTIVIVGYGADDPPMRYLMEVLAADRSRFTDLRPIYAFVSSEDGEDAAKKAAEWNARGAIPIVYGPDHTLLYDALRIWADHAEDPSAWRARRVRELTAQDPGTLSEAEWDQLEWSLTRGDGERLLAEANPAPAWVEPLGHRKLLTTDAAPPGRWLARRLSDREMIAACVSGVSLDDRSAAHVERALDDEEIAAETARFWRLELRRRRQQQRPWEEGWYRLLKRVKRGDSSVEARRAIAALLRPYAFPQRRLRLPVYDDKEDGSVYRVDFRLLDHVEPERLLELWPPPQDERLLRSLVGALDDALEEAVEHGFILEGFDEANFDVRSVASHPQDTLRDGFYPLVRTIADLLGRLGKSDRRAARRVAEELGTAEHILPRRIHLHLLVDEAIFEPDEAAGSLLDLNDVDFWSSDFQRETMRLMATRWSSFSPEARERLVARIATRPPLAIFHAEAGPPERLEALRDRMTFIRLARIDASGSGLAEAGTRILTALRAAHPQWIAGPGDRDDFPSWSETSVGMRGDVGLLDGVSAEDLVAEAERLQTEDPFGQGELWRLFVDAHPARALEGLMARSAHGDWPLAWTPLLWTLKRGEHPELEAQAYSVLEGAPAAAIAHLRVALSDWLCERHEAFLTMSPDPAERFLCFWDRCAEPVTSNPGQEEETTEDLETAILNKAPGALARVLVAELSRRKPERESQLPNDLRQRFDKAVAMEGSDGVVMRAAFLQQLPFLHWVDPDWAEAHLLPLLDPGRPDALQMWRVFLRNRNLGASRLCVRLRASFLSLFDHLGDAELPDGLVGRLLDLAAFRMRDELSEAEAPTPLEAKRALAKGGSEALREAAFIFFHRMKTADDPVVEWHDGQGALFRAVWPMDADLRTSDVVTLYLAWMALEAGGAFPDAVEAVLPALAPASRLNHSMIDDVSDGRLELYDTFPRAALRLLGAVVDPENPGRELAPLLDRLRRAEPALAAEPAFERLEHLSRRAAA